MRYLRAVSMAFSMYSRLPMPWVRWSDDCRAWVLCAFPLVGAVLGLLLLAWSALADLLTLTPQLRAAGAVLLPLAYTGGIHMDGFCDTCDALASHQDRARKLEILKDSRVGAFAVLGCVSYLLLQYALWCQPGWEKEDLWVLALVPVLSRAMSGYGAGAGEGAAAVFAVSVRSAGAGHRDAGGGLRRCGRRHPRLSLVYPNGPSGVRRSDG